jgi:hypothetical protein
MSDMDRRAFVGAAALGGVAAAVLMCSSAEAAGDNGGYFVIAEIVPLRKRRMNSAHCSYPTRKSPPRNRGV